MLFLPSGVADISQALMIRYFDHLSFFCLTFLLIATYETTITSTEHEKTYWGFSCYEYKSTREDYHVPLLVTV